MMNDMTMMMNEYDVIGINQCLRLPKAELNTKNSTWWQLWLPPGCVFGVQLGLRQTQALINTYHIILIHHHRHVIHHLSIHWKVMQASRPAGKQASRQAGQHFPLDR